MQPKNAIKYYLDSIGPILQLSADEQRELLLKWKNNDNKKALEKLVISCQTIVIKESKRFCNLGIEFIDLIQTGNYYLIILLYKYAENQKGNLKSYLHRNIFRSLLNYIINNFTTIRIPNNQINDLITACFKINHGINSHYLNSYILDDNYLKLLNKKDALLLNRESNMLNDAFQANSNSNYTRTVYKKINEDVSRIDLKKLSMPELTVKAEDIGIIIPEDGMNQDTMIDEIIKTMYFDKKVIYEEYEKKYYDINLNIPFYSIDDSYLKSLYHHDTSENLGSNHDDIMKILDILTDKEQNVIKMYYGINHTEMTLEEIGNYLNLTRERVRQIRQKVLEKLRHPNHSQKLVKLLVMDDYSGLSIQSTDNNELYSQHTENSTWTYSCKNNPPYPDDVFDQSEKIINEYIEPTMRKDFVKGVSNLTRHYQKLMTKLLTDIGHITLINKIRKNIKRIDGIFNNTIFSYAIKTSNNIKIVNDYIGLIEHFDAIESK